jgi:hypothetical protein
MTTTFRLASLLLALILITPFGAEAQLRGRLMSAVGGGEPVPEAEAFKLQAFEAYVSAWGSLVLGAEAQATLAEANGRKDAAGLIRAQLAELGSGPTEDTGSFNTAGLGLISQSVAETGELPLEDSELEGSGELFMAGVLELAGAVLAQINTISSIKALVESGASLAASLPSQGVNGVAAAASLRPYIGLLPELIEFELKALRASAQSLGAAVSYFRSRDIPVPSNVSDALSQFGSMGEQ